MGVLSISENHTKGDLSPLTILVKQPKIASSMPQVVVSCSLLIAECKHWATQADPLAASAGRIAQLDDLSARLQSGDVGSADALLQLEKIVGTEAVQLAAEAVASKQRQLPLERTESQAQAQPSPPDACTVSTPGGLGTMGSYSDEEHSPVRPLKLVHARGPGTDQPPGGQSQDLDGVELVSNAVQKNGSGTDARGDDDDGDDDGPDGDDRSCFHIGGNDKRMCTHARIAPTHTRLYSTSSISLPASNPPARMLPPPLLSLCSTPGGACEKYRPCAPCVHRSHVLAMRRLYDLVRWRLCLARGVARGALASCTTFLPAPAERQHVSRANTK